MRTAAMLAIIIAVIVCAGAVLTARRRPKHQGIDWMRGPVPEAPAAEQPVSSTPARYRRGQQPDDDPGALRVGDKVVLSGRTATVLATIGFREDVYAWTSALIGHGASREWVTIVTETGGLEIVRWRRLTTMPGSPDDQSVTFEGTTYLFEESGEAQFDAHGEVDLPGKGTMHYVDFKAGSQRLSFENYEGYGWEASAGTVVPLGELVRRA